MLEISPCKTNLNPLLDVRMPEPYSVSSPFSSFSHSGCVKSTVPRREIPLSRAYLSRFFNVIELDVALLKREWICRSATILMHPPSASIPSRPPDNGAPGFYARDAFSMPLPGCALPQRILPSKDGSLPGYSPEKDCRDAAPCSS